MENLIKGLGSGLGLLGRCILAIVVFGAVYLLFFNGICWYFVVFERMIHLQEAYTEGNGGKYSLTSGLGGVKQVTMDSLSTHLSKLVSVLVAAVMATSCLSTEYRRALLGWVKGITGLIIGGYVFGTLYGYMVKLACGIIGSVMGHSDGYISDPEQREHAYKALPADIHNFIGTNFIPILAVVAVVTGLIAWFIVSKLVYDEVLPWCRFPLIEVKSPRHGFLEITRKRESVAVPPPVSASPGPAVNIPEPNVQGIRLPIASAARDASERIGAKSDQGYTLWKPAYGPVACSRNRCHDSTMARI